MLTVLISGAASPALFVTSTAALCEDEVVAPHMFACSYFTGKRTMMNLSYA